MAWLREFKAAAESKRLELDGEPVAADMVPAVDELALKPRALVYSRLNAAQEKLVEAVLNRVSSEICPITQFSSYIAAESIACCKGCTVATPKLALYPVSSSPTKRLV